MAQTLTPTLSKRVILLLSSLLVANPVVVFLLTGDLMWTLIVPVAAIAAV